MEGNINELLNSNDAKDVELALGIIDANPCTFSYEGLDFSKWQLMNCKYFKAGDPRYDWVILLASREKCLVRPKIS